MFASNIITRGWGLSWFRLCLRWRHRRLITCIVARGGMVGLGATFGLQIFHVCICCIFLTCYIFHCLVFIVRHHVATVVCWMYPTLNNFYLILIHYKVPIYYSHEWPPEWHAPVDSKAKFLNTNIFMNTWIPMTTQFIFKPIFKVINQHVSKLAK